MKMYVFFYEAKPTRGSPEFGKVGGAHIDIWVYDATREAAEARALSYLMDLRWVVTAVGTCREVTEEQLLGFRKDAQANYSQAKSTGVSAGFYGYPPTERDDETVEIWPLSRPRPDSNADH